MTKRNDNWNERQAELKHVLNERQLERLADMYHKYGHYQEAIDTLKILLKLRKHNDPNNFRRSA